jgi:hypothetical protein
MSVPKCSRCKAHYWRFNPAHPPPNYCSNFCFDNRKSKPKESAPSTPQDVLARMYDHRKTAHGTADILVWYDCKTCEELEREYSSSLEWHSARVANELAADNRGRKTA